MGITDIRRTMMAMVARSGDRPAALALSVILILTAAIRLYLANDFNLTLDEATLVEFAQGILKRGYPFIMVGTMEVPLATYELVPYPIAISMAIFGLNEFAVRLPSILFGTGTAVLIFIAARRWFDLRTAILASMLYALSPWAIYWGHNCFHPAQAQFFATLTLIRAHSLLSNPMPPRASYYQTALFFVLAFLSWEGIGFMLPILFIAGLVINWGKWRWLKHRHLWYATACIVAVVAAQGIRRVLLQVSYLMVGSGKSETSLPQLVFTQSDYNPWFYIANFFGLESNLVLTAVFIAGLFFLKNNRDMRYVYAVVIGAIFFLTNFLSFSSAHYVYWVLPFFLMGVAAATFKFADSVVPRKFQSGFAVRASGTLAILLLLALEMGTATPFGLKMYDLVGHWQDPKRTDLRIGLAGVDYKGVSKVLQQEYLPGDVVVTIAAMPMGIYGGTRGDYFLEGVTAQKVIYDPGAKSPRYVDKYVGNPVLRGVEELESICYRNKRVWLFIAPVGIFFKLQDPALVDFINKRMKVVAESYDATLYLWDH